MSYKAKKADNKKKRNQESRHLSAQGNYFYPEGIGQFPKIQMFTLMVSQKEGHRDKSPRPAEDEKSIRRLFPQRAMTPKAYTLREGVSGLSAWNHVTFVVQEMYKTKLD